MNFRNDQFLPPLAMLSNARAVPLPHQNPFPGEAHRLLPHVFLLMKNPQQRLARIQAIMAQELLLVVLPKRQQLHGQIAPFRDRIGALCQQLRLLHIDPTRLLILQQDSWPGLKSFYLHRDRIAAKPCTHTPAGCQHSQ